VEKQNQNCSGKKNIRKEQSWRASMLQQPKRKKIKKKELKIKKIKANKVVGNKLRPPLYRTVAL